MLESVKLRLRADVEVGIYLSGGLDSSAIAGMTAHLIKQGELLGNDSSGDISKMSCYTIRFGKDTGVDESGTNGHLFLLGKLSNLTKTSHNERQIGLVSTCIQ